MISTWQSRVNGMTKTPKCANNYASFAIGREQTGLVETQRIEVRMPHLAIDLWVACGVMVTTAITDAAYGRFTAAVAARRRLVAANWGGLLYLLLDMWLTF
jgi:hypothetical protein